MKIDILQTIINYEGLPVYQERAKRDTEGKTVRDKDGQPVVEDEKLTLRGVINTALMVSEPEKVRTSDDKNIARPILNKIWEKKEVDFTTKEGGYIIEKVGIFFNPLVLERVEGAFDGKGKDEQNKTSN